MAIVRQFTQYVVNKTGLANGLCRHESYVGIDIQLLLDIPMQIQWKGSRAQKYKNTFKEDNC